MYITLEEQIMHLYKRYGASEREIRETLIKANIKKKGNEEEAYKLTERYIRYTTYKYNKTKEGD